MIVYKATNCINNKVYFCVTGRAFNDAVSMKISTARAKPRKMKLKDAYTGKSPFSKAILRHGAHNFKFEILHSRISQKKAYDLKKKYIKDYDAMNPEYGYNCTTGELGSFKHADHVKDRISVAHTGRTMPESWIEFMKDEIKNHPERHPTFQKGYKHTEEVREIMRQGQLNSDYVQSEESKKRTSETMKERWREPTEQMLKDAYNKKHQIGSRDIRGKKNPMYGKGMKGKDNPMYGKPAWNRGVPMTEENKQKLQEGREKHRRKATKELAGKYKNRTEKKCTQCNKVKPVNEFDKSYNNSIDPFIARCKPCEKVRAREKYYRLRSPNKIKNRFGKLIKDVIQEAGND